MFGKTKKVLKIFLDTVEIYIPTLSFLTLFVVFVLQIFFRYILRDPLTWGIELTEIMFIWTVMLGASYARRKRDHVAFSLFYDMLPAKGQLYLRILANVFVAVPLIFAILPLYEQLSKMARNTSSVLDVPFHVIYAPLFLLMISFIAHSIYDIISDLRKLFDKNNQDYTESMYLDQFDEEELDVVPEVLEE